MITPALIAKQIAAGPQRAAIGTPRAPRMWLALLHKAGCEVTGRGYRRQPIEMRYFPEYCAALSMGHIVFPQAETHWGRVTGMAILDDDGRPVRIPLGPFGEISLNWVPFDSGPFCVIGKSEVHIAHGGVRIEHPPLPLVFRRP